MCGLMFRFVPVNNMRLYFDTSIFGGYFDDEFNKWTIPLFEEIKKKRHVVVISNVTISELEKAPDRVGGLLNIIPGEVIEFVSAERNAEYLASLYVKEDVIARKYIVDALHIATATLNRVDVLVSWNFKHMVNLKHGYPLIDIRSPMEVISEN